MYRLLIALSFVGCTATVRTAPPPVEPAGPPPPPPGPVATQPPPPPPPAPAPPPPSAHPHYGEAIHNLRVARLMVDRAKGFGPDVKFDESVAMREINDAIREIKEAKQDDGMAAGEIPERIDPKMLYRDRLREAHRRLELAARELETREDNAWARQDRKQALDHTRRAWTAVGEAIGDRAADAAAPPPPPPPGPPAPPAGHPAYATALGNLRHARALLERPAGAADVKWDEKNAIAEIDAAFGEVRQARMDDGAPMTEHPPIDNKLVYRDRLREALKLLGDASHDLEQREDNAWAKKDRKQAIEHVKRAEKAVREAVSDRKADAAEKAEIKEEKREEKAEKKAKGH